MVSNLTLVEVAKGRVNNFDMIGFVAATLVIISHAYPLTEEGAAS